MMADFVTTVDVAAVDNFFEAVEDRKVHEGVVDKLIDEYLWMRDRIGSDWIGLDRVRLDWIGLGL